MAGVSGVGLAYATAGGVLLWSGLKGQKVGDLLRSVLSGNASAPQTETVSGISLTGSYGPGSSAPASTADTPSVTGGSDIAGAGSTYSQAQLQQLWTANGGDPATAGFAARVAEAESGGRTAVTSSNPDGGTNVGLWQLDTRGVGSGWSVKQLSDPATNCRITIMATRNGRDWTEWGDPVTAAVNYHYNPG